MLKCPPRFSKVTSGAEIRPEAHFHTPAGLSLAAVEANHPLPLQPLVAQKEALWLRP